MSAFGTGFADGIDEVDFRCAIGGKVFDQKNALAFMDVTFDAGLAAKALGLFADILHRQVQNIGQPRGIGDARGFTTGDRIKCLVTGLVGNLTGGKFHDLAACAREGNQFAAINIDRAGPARCQDIGLFRAEIHSPDIKQNLCDGFGSIRAMRGRSFVGHGGYTLFRIEYLRTS